MLAGAEPGVCCLGRAHAWRGRPCAGLRLKLLPSRPQVLAEFGEKRNCVECCNREGLMRFLERQQSELEACEKALADYMESKRRCGALGPWSWGLG